MGNPTFIQKYFTWPIANLVDDIEYYFAERWLNKTFGQQEYWGDLIGELLSKKYADELLSTTKSGGDKK